MEIAQNLTLHTSKLALRYHRAFMIIPQFVMFRYGVALLFVGAAFLLSLSIYGFLPDAFLIFFLSAVMLAGWFGRTGAGLFAVVVSMILVDYYFIPPYRAFVVELDQLPYLLTFLLSAIVTSWLGSARRTAEEKQKAHLDELFEQSPEAILLVDLQDRVLRINKEFTHIFGYTANEVITRSSIELIVPPQYKPEALNTRERLAGGTNVNIETIRMRKDGSYLNVSEVAFPVVADGKKIGYYVIFRDITESKQALEELHKTQSELAHLSRLTTMGELASSIAHEINQPIGAIVTNSNAVVRWLGQTRPDLKSAEEAMDWIVRDANRAAQVIDRIRALLRKNPTPMVTLDVNDVIREVVLLTRPETERRQTAVVMELADDLPHVLGDRVQLQQVLLNLVMNSLDAMSAIKDGLRELRIKTSESSECVLIQVLDSGPGLEPQHAQSIFDPFFTTKKDGIGMGLTISRSIVEAHGGRLWADRKRPHGAILNFTLPISTKVA
jgi:PAS domain S-box-containing protein